MTIYVVVLCTAVLPRFWQNLAERGNFEGIRYPLIRAMCRVDVKTVKRVFHLIEFIDPLPDGAPHHGVQIHDANLRRDRLCSHHLDFCFRLKTKHSNTTFFCKTFWFKKKTCFTPVFPVSVSFMFSDLSFEKQKLRASSVSALSLRLEFHVLNRQALVQRQNAGYLGADRQHMQHMSTQLG